MLDTHGRKYFNKIIDFGAKFFMKIGRNANDVTVLALIMGILTSILLVFRLNGLALLFLWISGFLDAVDGSIARITGTTSEFGALMDIVFDRIVEGGMIIAIGYLYPESRLLLIVLMFSIIISMTVFLTVGALAEKKGVKSFYYQAGLAERTEGFIMFSLMIIFPKNLAVIIIIFCLMILFTAGQRLLEARKILD